ncbi:unnamed protein product [Scytosiphon promiscuus]
MQSCNRVTAEGRGWALARVDVEPVPTVPQQRIAWVGVLKLPYVLTNRHISIYQSGAKGEGKRNRVAGHFRALVDTHRIYINKRPANQYFCATVPAVTRQVQAGASPGLPVARRAALLAVRGSSGFPGLLMNFSAPWNAGLSRCLVLLLVSCCFLRAVRASATMRFMEHLHGPAGGSSSSPGGVTDEQELFVSKRVWVEDRACTRLSRTPHIVNKRKQQPPWFFSTVVMAEGFYSPEVAAVSC